MPLVEAKYDQDKINSLKNYLRRESEKGRAKDYEIEVDGFRVVPRTDDIEEFDEFEMHVRDTTRNVTIKIYDGDSTPRNTKYSFQLNKDSIPAQPTNGLGGLGEVGQIIQQKLDEQNKEYQLERMKEKLEEAEQALSEAEEYNEKLVNEIAHLKENKYNLGSFNIAELGAEVLKYTIAKNANKSPLAANLSGILGALNNVPETAQEPREEDDYEASVEEAQEQPTPRQMAILHSIQQMEQVFNAQQLHTVTQLLIHLMNKPADLAPVAELLNIKTNDSNG